MNASSMCDYMIDTLLTVNKEFMILSIAVCGTHRSTNCKHPDCMYTKTEPCLLPVSIPVSRITVFQGVPANMMDLVSSKECIDYISQCTPCKSSFVECRFKSLSKALPTLQVPGTYFINQCIESLQN